MPQSEFPFEESHPDLTTILEQHLRVGFQLDLALDLVLNELVVRASEATHASSAAFALARGDELVCRAATGSFAPDLGVALNPHEGLSGVCLQAHEPQIAIDTEVDPRIAVAFSRRFGIRSILAVPVFDAVNRAEVTGVLEVFSTAPAAFSRVQQDLLVAYAEECSRIRQVALALSLRTPGAESKLAEANSLAVASRLPTPRVMAESAVSAIVTSDPIRPPAPASPPRIAVSPLKLPYSGPVRNVSGPVKAEPIAAAAKLVPVRPLPLPQSPPPSPREEEFQAPEIVPAEFEAVEPLPSHGYSHESAHESSYEVWTLVLAALAIFAIIGVSFLIGSRVGWLRATETPVQKPEAVAATAPPAAPTEARIDSSPIPPRATPAKPAQAKSSAQTSGRSRSKVVSEKSSTAAPDNGDLVVFEKGKVVFRIKNPPDAAEQQSKAEAAEGTANSAANQTTASPSAAGKTSSGVWLDPATAERLVLSQPAPQYPAEAQAAGRSGDVVLEIEVAEDGAVASVHTLSGDALLASAASRAISSWRYQPYRVHDRPAKFHTRVTVSFPASN